MVEDHKVLAPLRQLLLSPDLSEAVQQHSELIPTVIKNAYAIHPEVKQEVKGYAALLAASLEVLVVADSSFVLRNAGMFYSLFAVTKDDRSLQKKGVDILDKSLRTADTSDDYFGSLLYNATWSSSHLEQGSETEIRFCEAVVEGIKRYSSSSPQNAWEFADVVLNAQGLTEGNHPAPSPALVRAVQEIMADVIHAFKPEQHPARTDLDNFRAQYLGL